MALYRVVLADDEEEIREGIIRKIAWESLGFEVAGAAENGLEALELIEHLRPDVVLTDIRMPFLSGLELAEKVAALLPFAKLVILSGYDDFEYAQQAIKLHVAEYLLKPINAAELTETLKKLRQRLDEEDDNRRDVETLRRHYAESFPVLREQFFVSLLEGRVPDGRLASQAEAFGLDHQKSTWAVALLHARPKETFREPQGETLTLHGEEELIPISILRTAEELLERFCQFHSFFYSEDVALLLDLDTPERISAALGGLNEVCKSAESVLGVRVFAGIGSPTALSALRYSYREAQSALDYGSIIGYSRANFIKDVEPSAAVQLQFGEEDERAVVSALKLGGEPEIKEEVYRIFSRFETLPVALNQYQIYLMEVVTALMKVMRAYDINPDEIFGQEFNFLTVISSLHTPHAIKQWLIENCIKVSACIRRERVDSTKLLAQNAKQYIRDHFEDPEMSVEQLCSHLHVSPAYFSTVFKRETEMSFVSYLTEVRLQKALHLLDTTDDKTYLVAEKVGYTEPNYFSYVFKKRFGVSPSKYRSAKAQAVPGEHEP